MKTRMLLFATMLLWSVCSLGFSQKLTLGIFPEPQELTISNQSYIPTEGYAFKNGEAGLDPDAVKVLKEALPFSSTKKALPLEVKSLKDKSEEMQRSGAYIINITKKGMTIEIVDDASLFYAAQTLKQLAIYVDGQKVVPLCTIKDYPDVPARGIIEGFYGRKWSHSDRIEMLRYCGELKMNTYIYGPKDDSYIVSPNWREPYPAAEGKLISELVEEANHNKVNFVWAVLPGQDIQWNEADRDKLIAKFEHVYGLGVRAFALFFDDITGEGTRPEKQAELLNYIQNEFIAKKDDVQPLIICPTEYSRSTAKTNYIDVLSEQLDPSIEIMWTGDQVVTDNITKESLEWVNNRTHRKAYVWWNFPVNDYCQDHLMLGASYGLDTEAEGTMCGFVANPMVFAEASKVPLFGVGLYGWNIERYDAEKAWGDACDYLMPEANLAFRTFCEHNTDPGPNTHNFHRTESASYKGLIQGLLDDYKKGHFADVESNQINTLFAQISSAPRMIISQNQNKRLVSQLMPWLTQFEMLGKAGTSAISMAQAWKEKDKAHTWQLYLETSVYMDSMSVINHTMNQEGQTKGVKCGSRVLYPFIEDLYNQTSRNLMATDETSASEINVSVHSVISNIEQLKYQPYVEEYDRISFAPVFEVVTVAPNEYLGMGWKVQNEAESFTFNLPHSNLPGRVFEWSEDGKTWKTLEGIPADSQTETIKSIDPKARFIRMRNGSSTPMDINLQEFAINLMKEPEIDPTLTMYDMNLDTYNTLHPGETVNVKCDDVETLTFFLSGSNENLVSIVGRSADDETDILYQGNVGYIKLNKSIFEDYASLELSTIGGHPIHVHQIIRE